MKKWFLYLMSLAAFCVVHAAREVKKPKDPTKEILRLVNPQTISKDNLNDAISLAKHLPVGAPDESLEVIYDLWDVSNFFWGDKLDQNWELLVDAIWPSEDDGEEEKEGAERPRQVRQKGKPWDYGDPKIGFYLFYEKEKIDPKTGKKVFNDDYKLTNLYKKRRRKDGSRPKLFEFFIEVEDEAGNKFSATDWVSSEQYYQTMKFWNNPKAMKEVYSAPDRGERAHFNKAREVAVNYSYDIDWWHNHIIEDGSFGGRSNNLVEVGKDAVMMRALLEKFTQNKDLKDYLLKTGNRTLIENAGKHDDYWGNGKKDSTTYEHGDNKLGRMLGYLRWALAEDAKKGNTAQINKIKDELAKKGY